jgi:hypothetical protein
MSDLYGTLGMYLSGWNTLLWFYFPPLFSPDGWEEEVEPDWNDIHIILNYSRDMDGPKKSWFKLKIKTEKNIRRINITPVISTMVSVNIFITSLEDSLNLSN